MNFDAIIDSLICRADLMVNGTVSPAEWTDVIDQRHGDQRELYRYIECVRDIR